MEESMCNDFHCPNGFEAICDLTHHVPCTCSPICELQECPGIEMSVRGPFGCMCVLECDSLVRCPWGMTVDFNETSRQCYCRTPNAWEILGLGKYYNYAVPRLAQIEKRMASSSTTAVGGSFTGTPTPLPSGINTSNPAVASFIPPPKTDITPQLIQQSLNQQPQNIATIITATPYFMDGVIVFGVQLLGGPVASIITMNASTTIPCGSIGTNPEVGLIVVPYTVKNGTPQVTLSSCLVIAVNMYNPDSITYWVQRRDGTLFSLLGDNQIHDLDKINTSVPAFANILTNDTITSKRDLVVPEIKISKPIDLGGRSLEEVNDYTATMTKEACLAMRCNNNNGAPALYNPFQQTCYCQSTDYVEINPSGDSV